MRDEKISKHVIQRVLDSDLKIPWYDRNTSIEDGLPRYLVDNHAPISVNSVIEDLQKQNFILREALKFYANYKLPGIAVNYVAIKALEQLKD